MELVKFVPVLQPPDIASVSLLAHAVWTEYYSPFIEHSLIRYILGKYQSEKAIAEQITRENYLYYFVKDGRDVVLGYFALVPREAAGELFLSKFYIRAEERAKGYGRHVLDFAEKTARSWGLSRITLTVNKKNQGSIAAYERMGFSRVDAVVTDIGEGFVMDDYVMQKELHSK